MKHRGSKTLLALLAPVLLSGQGTESTGVPVRVVVTVEGRHDGVAPELTRDDIAVRQGDHRRPVTGWTPLRGNDAALQLWILIDDSAGSGIGAQFGDLRKFIAAQPPETAIGIGYMRNGTVDPVQPLTPDHERAARAIRIPAGLAGGSASPYFSLKELVRKWPDTAARRAVLMIASGIDYYYGAGPENPYLQQAIDAAQRAGVTVSSIYWGGIGHFAHSQWQISWGQSNLGQLCEATGGETYWQGFGNPVSLSPFLDDFGRRLQHQYRLTFLAEPGKKSEFQRISLSTEIPNATVEGPTRVWVPGQ
jgi:hypothetical protein